MRTPVTDTLLPFVTFLWVNSLFNSTLRLGLGRNRLGIPPFHDITEEPKRVQSGSFGRQSYLYLQSVIYIYRRYDT